MTRSNIGLVCLALGLLFTLTVLVSGSEIEIIRSPTPNLSGDEVGAPSALSESRDTYTGTVRLYLVEPVSRWSDATATRFSYGFLAFGLEDGLNLPDQERWNKTVHWNAESAGYGDVAEDNIMAIAVINDLVPHVQDAYPPNEYWFDAYYVDAAAGVTPGNFGENATADGFTHTVFLEEGTSDT